MKEEKRPYHDGLSFPSANVPGITPESAFTDGYLTALHNMDNTGSADSVNIDEDGKASDMDDQSVMSGDGCNPVNKDSEMNRAHDDDAGWIFPGVYPNSGMPGTSPGAYPGIIPPVYFPGAGGTPDL